jgi:protein transport protein SEC13
MIHDAQMDYYGRKLATCSSDCLVKIWEIDENIQKLLAELKGHEGPVWQVAWGHPKYGNILASCSYDRKVIIWREINASNWEMIYEYGQHQQSVNSIAWAPPECGLMLACASSDGTISVLSWDSVTWRSVNFEAHNMGANSVSWAPSLIPTSFEKSSADKRFVPRLVTGGCDNMICVWHQKPDQNFEKEDTLEGHTDWVRDVAWAPNIGLPYATIASCSQDGVVIIWTKGENSDNWSQQILPMKFDEVVWRVSWSIIGNILAVSSGDNRVTLWKESLEHDWSCISTVGI